MKQRVTPEQMNELSAEQITLIYHWWQQELGDYVTDFNQNEDGTFFVGVCKYIKENASKPPLCPLLSIGQMIDFLGDDWYKKLFVSSLHDSGVYKNLIYFKNSDCLCDALWEAVKSVLSENTK